jgi:type I restriction enzyme M protein
LDGGPHFRLGDVLLPIGERFTSGGEPVSRADDATYKYIEIGDADAGTYRWSELRGWELPDRAKHFAEAGDLYLGAVWGSVRKWLFVGEDVPSLVVTNGFLRLRFKPGKEHYFIDVVAGLCSDAYATQMRAFARGSDGLAEITAHDALEVVLPRVTRKRARAELEPFVEQLRAGHTSFEAKVQAMLDRGLIPAPPVTRRPDHTAIV